MAAERVENMDRWPVLLLADPSIETDTLMVELDSIAHQLQEARYRQGVRRGFRAGWFRGFIIGATLSTLGAFVAVVVWGWTW